MDSVFEKTGLRPEDNLIAASSVGVTKVVQIGCDVTSSQWAVEFAAANPAVIAAVAVHPNDAARLTAKELDAALGEIDALAGSGSHVRAVGETGLDYYRTRDSAGQAQQRASFADHIAIAAARGLTLAIHDREAHSDILRVLDDAPLRPERVIMHCFSGCMAFARDCVERGYWLSFPGTVTFKGSEDLRDALTVTPLDRLLVETDAPYLTPVPARGRPNASYLVAHTVAFIAEYRGDDLAVLCDALRANAEAAYGGAWGTA
ncbi:MAG: TatD family hydrolase [Propionibacteriaceae bacterium]|nr:TatD family hydrolase [Propionibacteriaceae bacterium]